MVSFRLRRISIVLCGLLLACLALAACGDDPPPTPEPAEQQSSPQPQDAQPSAAAPTQSQPSAERISEQDADAQPEPTPEVAQPEIEIDSDTVWRDLYDMLSEAERSCLHEELGADLLQTILDSPLLFEGEAEAWMATVYGCLTPERARDVFVSSFMAQIAEDEDVEFSESEQSCLRESVSTFDPAATIAAMTYDAGDPAAAAEFYSAVVRCIPDLFVTSMVGEMGVAVEDLSEAETSCLREWVLEIDWAPLIGAADSDDPAAFLSFSLGALSCIPQLLVSDFAGSDLVLTEEESACLRATFSDLDADAVGEAMGGASESAGFAAFASAIFGCVPQLALFEVLESEPELTESERSCLRDSFEELDPSVLVAAMSLDLGDTEARVELAQLLLGCVPRLILADVVGMNEQFSEEEVICLRDSFGVAGFAAILSADEGFDTQASLSAALLNCVPDLFVEALAGDRELSADEESCLHDLIANTDAAALISEGEGSEAFASFSFALLACVPDLFLPEPAVEETLEPQVEFDPAAAMPLAVGQVVERALEDGADSDVFVFEAEPDQIYQIDVTLGTLDDSVLTLYDADEGQLAYNDDQPGSRASRIYWRAPGASRYYVQVRGYGSGSYSLIVFESDIVDDHGDSAAEASAATIGEPARGALDYAGDVDVFEFAAEAGQSYAIDVILDSLSDSVLRLLDADGFQLAYNDDFSPSTASRIYWEAPDSGRFYAEVSGFAQAVGSYTVTVAASDIADDHGDYPASATAVTIGESVPGDLQHDLDADYFAFEAESGRTYQIDVTLGTLDDSVIELFDDAGHWLGSNDDHDNTLASRIIWTAPRSGTYYLWVGGHGAQGGSYTVLIAVR